MSDQHLVTGMAMLIALYAILLGAGDLRAKKSVYVVSVAVSLAAFSTITHTLSFCILRYHFKKEKRAAKLRV
jgi:hypothetical protein